MVTTTRLLQHQTVADNQVLKAELVVLLQSKLKLAKEVLHHLHLRHHQVVAAKEKERKDVNSNPAKVLRNQKVAKLINPQKNRVQ